MGFWESDGESADDYLHASLHYDDVASSGPAARPLEFPTPTVHSCERIELVVKDHRSGTVHRLRNVIMKHDSFGVGGDTAYLVKKKLAKSVYGSVRLCIVLKRCHKESQQESREDAPVVNSSEVAEWESTDTRAVVKASSWSRIHAMRGRHLEDPIKEIAAMQHLGNYNPHVLGAREVLQDDTFLYTVMKYLPNGDLYGRLVGDIQLSSSSEDSESDSHGLNEKQIRVWFRQLLLGLFHLQKKGVCHRDISLENILLDDNDQVVIIDPGMSLRVPYSDPSNYGCVTDASAGTSRRLMKNQGQGGKLMYAAPEVIEREEVFDGFALDLFGAGVVLFVMLVGLAPFKWAHPSDKRYARIAKGGLKELLSNLEITVSDEACDLLQGMFWRNPRKRYTLAEVMDHPWVIGRTRTGKSIEPTALRKKSTFNETKHQKNSSTTSSNTQRSCDKQKVRFGAGLNARRISAVTPNFWNYSNHEAQA